MWSFTFTLSVNPASALTILDCQYFRSTTEIQMCLCHELYALCLKWFVFKNRITDALTLATVSWNVPPAQQTFCGGIQPPGSKVPDIPGKRHGQMGTPSLLSAAAGRRQTTITFCTIIFPTSNLILALTTHHPSKPLLCSLHSKGSITLYIWSQNQQKPYLVYPHVCLHSWVI